MMPKRRHGHFLPYLVDWRGKKFLTQLQLKDISGVSVTTIQYLEDESQPHPANGSTVLKLAEALGLIPETLIDVDPKPLSTAETKAHFEAGKSYYAEQKNKASA